MKKLLITLLLICGSLNAQSLILTMSTGTNDTTPDVFTFTDQTLAELSTSYTSDSLIVTGILTTSAMTITGGNYRIGLDGTPASAATNATLGDTIWVIGTSSGSYSTAVNVVLTIGGVSDTYTITTKADPNPAPSVLSDSTTYGWYELAEANFTLTTGDSVDVWEDLSVYGYDLDSSVAGSKPIRSAGGVTFDGTDDYLMNNWGVVQTDDPFTVYAVVNQIAHNGLGLARIFETRAITIAMVRQADPSPTINMRSTSTVAANTDLAVGTYGILTTIFNGASSSLKVNTETAETGNPGDISMYGFSLASNQTGASNFANVAFKAFIIRNAADDSTMQDSIRTYLNTKYSVY